MQSNNKTTKRTQESGISKLPKVLPYPQLLSFESTPSIHNIFCYIIDHYGGDGLSVLIYRQIEKDQVTVICGDWAGNNIDIINSSNRLASIGLEFTKNDLVQFLQTMRLININQAQFFFSIDETGILTLVDMQIAHNKFASPGMIRDIFSKIYKTQKIIKTEIIDTRAIEAIKKGTGSYKDNIILKPTKFKVYHDIGSNLFQPLYVEIKR